MKLGDLLRRKSSEPAAVEARTNTDAPISTAPRHASGQVEPVAAVSSEASTLYLYHEGDELWGAWEGEAEGIIFGRKLKPTEPFLIKERLREVGLNGHSVQLHQENFLIVLDGETFLLDPLPE